MLFSVLGLILLGWPIFVAAEQPSSRGKLHHIASQASLEILVEGHLSGSGWFADSQGWAFTAAHVVRNFGRVEVVSPKYGRLPAEVTAFDLGHDLALLKIPRYGEPYPFLGISPETPNFSESVQLFGSPLGRHGLMLPGTLVAPETRFEWSGRNRCYIEVLLISAMTPEGVSGGPWLNRQGEVVGLQSGMMEKQGQFAGVAFAAPPSALRQLLRARKTVKTIALGGTLTEAWEVARRIKEGEERAEGLYFVPQSGSGGLTGLKPNDLIVAMDGKKVRYRDDFLRAIRSHVAGDSLRLNVLRQNGDLQLLTFDLQYLDDY